MMKKMDYDYLFDEADERIKQNELNKKIDDDKAKKREADEKIKKIKEETQKLSETINNLVLDTIKNAQSKTGEIDTSKYDNLGYPTDTKEIDILKRFKCKIAKKNPTGYKLDENGLQITINYSSLDEYDYEDDDDYDLPIFLTDFNGYFNDSYIDYNYLNELLNRNNIYVEVIAKHYNIDKGSGYRYEYTHILKITVPRKMNKAKRLTRKKAII